MADVILENITKTYNKGKVLALDAVSFAVDKGALFGLIGPDGAGKTSLFRILTTLLVPDGGTAIVNGEDVVKDYQSIRRKVGYMPGRFSLYQDLTVAENLNFFATLFGTTIQENYDLIKDIYVQIEPFKDRRAGKLSGGMKQKLALCCALIHKPTVLFLDEPTTGVDPVSRQEFWHMLNRLRDQGITILVSTPYMDEATLCDKIALIQGGRIMSVDTPEGIIKQFGELLLAVKSNQMIQLLQDLREYPDTASCYTFGEYHHLTLKDNTSYQNQLSELKDYLTGKGYKGDLVVEPVAPTIEDCFIKLMSQAGRQPAV
ncbi:ABC transporter ATP-binding protein [Pontibacter sp. 172403-2]|uniref:ABC transporter ATP-binding protein n=1 Tax=Pontibacter rufus TaxID=2791028 RepID=UPI0018B00A2B|nr:ABC transporter ATP-binding protein [Pontibacter sp. 172403-2]MBF9254055.1 ABC transporter ATP-binding protein [Pontibacter sp. 172403-2]